jgi:hypothetical protein
MLDAVLEVAGKLLAHDTAKAPKACSAKGTLIALHAEVCSFAAHPDFLVPLETLEDLNLLQSCLDPWGAEVKVLGAHLTTLETCRAHGQTPGPIVGFLCEGTPCESVCRSCGS